MFPIAEDALDASGVLVHALTELDIDIVWIEAIWHGWKFLALPGQVRPKRPKRFTSDRPCPLLQTPGTGITSLFRTHFFTPSAAATGPIDNAAATTATTTTIALTLFNACGSKFCIFGDVGPNPIYDFHAGGRSTGKIEVGISVVVDDDFRMVYSWAFRLLNDSLSGGRHKSAQLHAVGAHGSHDHRHECKDGKKAKWHNAFCHSLHVCRHAQSKDA